MQNGIHWFEVDWQDTSDGTWEPCYLLEKNRKVQPVDASTH